MSLYKLSKQVVTYSFALYTISPVANYYSYSLGFGNLNFSLISLLLILFFTLSIRFFESRNSIYPKAVTYIFICKLIFLVVTIASYFYSRNMDYAATKVFALTVNIIVAFAFTLVIDKEHLIKYSKITILLSLAVGLLYPYFYSGLIESSIELSKDNVSVYLTTGALLAFCGVILISIKPFSSGNGFLLIFIYLELAMTGARGPIMFLLLCHLLYELTINRRLLYLTFILPFFGIVFALVLNEDSGETILSRLIWRFALLFDGDSGARFEYWTVYYEKMTNFKTLLFGDGLGSFGVVKHGFAVKDHPHNLVLGIMSDSGLIGLLGFIMILFFYLRYFMSRKLYPYFILILLPFLELQKSSTYAEYRLFWIAMAITICIGMQGKNSSLKREIEK